ncbi:phosphatidylinositol 3-kinase regulatory subunit alpha isoform X2 [Hydra vulgaris]|uniref:Phosphatidylinositol 3-kinase regulatory subunit alpha isoform X2 n=1 Tax=Hydra vulgaris TaxID=6087 RepID=A0ABM4C652_HYDVU
MGERDFVVFIVNHDYLPKEGEIELKVGDECYVKKPVENPYGLLEGVNIRTKASGRFPGKYCSIVNENTPPPRPSKPKPDPNRSKFFNISNHHIEKVNIKRPMWCENCDEYIWGGSRISFMCTKCLRCTHIGCHRVFQKECLPVSLSLSRDSILKPVTTWSCEEVMEWMVASHLHMYLNLFKANHVKGVDLANVNEQHLKNIGMGNDLHIKQLTQCLDELLLDPPTASELTNNIPLSTNNNINCHRRLYEHTFTTLQNCDLCKKPMFGIIKQGFMCADCGKQCHRSCAFDLIGPCSERLSGRRPSDSPDPSFCCNFTSVVIPPVMRKCIEMIESFEILTENIYTKNVPYIYCNALRSALNQDPETVNMFDDAWSDPSFAAYVLKSFLLELPNPFLSEFMYDSFINLASSGHYSLQDITELYSNLHPSCRSHLNVVLRHLLWAINNCANNVITAESLTVEFAILLVRPLDYQADKLVAHFDKHKEVVKMLLWYISQREISEAENSGEDWFWADATKREVSLALRGKCDGSFLVRKSENRLGEWTLTVMKDGRERFIKIMQHNGRFGFQISLLNFSSLKFLIEYFKDHSLNEMNSNLDTCLNYPCVKQKKILVNENDQVVQKKFKQIDEKLKEIKIIEFKKEEMQLRLEECKMLSESQTDIVNFISAQYDLAFKQIKEASPEDQHIFLESKRVLESILQIEKNTWNQLDAELVTLTYEYDTLKAQLTDLGTELPVLQEEYSQLEKQMEKYFPDEKMKIQSEKMEDIYDVLPVSQPRRQSIGQEYPTPDGLDESLWLFGDLEREQIVEMLENKPNGTFLVRKSKQYTYCISLVHDKGNPPKIKHIPILRGPNGYGFAEPHNIYPTLQSLINHYHSQSLRMHNSSLDTTLKTPYRFFEH